MTKGNQLIAVKRAGTGLGLFGLQDIQAFQRIIEYTGPLITNDEVAEMREVLS